RAARDGAVCSVRHGAEGSEVELAREANHQGVDWTIPSSTRQKGHSGKLNLPPAALDIIEAQPEIADNPYVLPSTIGNGRFNSLSQRKAELDEKNTRDAAGYAALDFARLTSHGAKPHASGQGARRSCRARAWPCDSGVEACTIVTTTLRRKPMCGSRP